MNSIQIAIGLARLGLLATLLASAAAQAQRATSLWYQTLPGTYYSGDSRTYRSPADTFQLGTSGPAQFELSVSSNGVRETLNLAPASGDTLGVGAYEGARSSYSFSYGTSRVPTLAFSTINTPNCYDRYARFTILELELDSDFHVATLAADFEQDCNGAGPRYGEVRYNSTVPLTIDKPANSVVSDPFAFKARNMLRASMTVLSNQTTIYGINAPVGISVSNGEYSLNGGAFTSAPGTAINRDRVQLRAVSSASLATPSTATLFVGNTAANFNLSTFTPGQPFTGLFLRPRPPYTINGAATLEGYAPEWAISSSGNSELLNIDMRGGSLDTWQGAPRSYILTIAAPPGATLMPGSYEEARRAPFRGSAPGIEFSGSGTGCNTVLGRFTILDIDMASNGAVNRLAVNFEHWCEGNSLSATYGEVRINSAMPFSVMKPVPSTLPDPFTLSAQEPVRPGVLVTSNWFSIYGVNADVPISVSGGEYSLNGAPYTSAPGTAHELDDIVVRLRASNTSGATTTATFDAGGRTANFSVATYQPGTALTGLYFTIPSGPTRLYLGPRSKLQVNNGSPDYMAFTLEGSDGGRYNLTLSAPSGQALAPGNYEGTLRFNSATAGGLDFSGNGVGCNQSSGRFVVYEVAFTQGVLTRFAADFEHYCDSSTTPRFGELRLNSTVPFSALRRRLLTDYNVDGRGDVLWRNSSSGQVYRMLMNGASITSAGFAYTESDTAWRIVGDGDFNGDGVSDLLWRNDVLRKLYVLHMGPDGMPASGGYVANDPIPEWQVIATPDIDGDGRADILWWNSVTGQVSVMLMNGNAIARQAYVYSEPDTHWRPVAAADFTGAGKQNQLLWRHALTGQVYRQTFIFTATSFSQSGSMIYQEPNLDWKIVATPDLDGDYRADILWRNEVTGQVHGMLMDGATIRSQGGIYREANTAWKIVAQSDYNGDGKADLLWRNETTGQVYMMLMNGLAIASQATVYTEPNTDWKVMGPYEYAQ